MICLIKCASYLSYLQKIEIKHEKLKRLKERFFIYFKPKY